MENRGMAVWRIAGHEIGREWLAVINPASPIAPQVTACLAKTATERGDRMKATDWGVVHLSCPWAEWSGRRGLAQVCQAKCDAWLQEAVRTVNEALGSHVRVQTIQTIPSGEATCARKIWEEVPG